MITDPGSFRDPAAVVVHGGGRIFRILREEGREAYRELERRRIYEAAIEEGFLIPTVEVDEDVGIPLEDGEVLIEHQKVPFLSYPYEWPFELLKSAALFHLEFHLRLLESGAGLIDASAYNVQFEGTTPIFIDFTSVRPYVEGRPWMGQRQFVEQFLAPLVLHSRLGVPYHRWYRGSISGIPLEGVAPLLKLRHHLSPTLLGFILGPASLQRRGRARLEKVASRARAATLSLRRLRALLIQLRDYIGALDPPDAGGTTWGRYEEDNPYGPDEADSKLAFVEEYVRSLTAPRLVDLGCNTGLYSERALGAGASLVIGFDADHGALGGAVRRAREKRLDFLPLYQDLLDPTPNSGWRLTERSAVFERLDDIDGVLALALLHHLVIGGNVPLDSATRFLTGLAPSGVIEFVPKSDPAVQVMLSSRDDVFPDYTLDRFVAELGRAATIRGRRRVSETGRELFWFTRA